MQRISLYTLYRLTVVHMIRYEWVVYCKLVLSRLVECLTVQGLARGEGARLWTEADFASDCTRQYEMRPLG